MNGSHPCAVPGCTRTIFPDLLMCQGHWRQVPEDLKAKVNAAWRAFRDCPDPFSLPVFRARYDLAVKAAVEAVTAKEHSQ